MNVRKLLFAAILFAFLTRAEFVFAQVVDYPYKYGSVEIFESEDLLDEEILRLAELKLFDALDAYPESPANDKAALLRARLEIAENNTKIADGVLSEFLSRRPNSPLKSFALTQRGMIAFERDDWSSSERNLAEACRVAEEDFRDRGDSIYYEVAYNAMFWLGVAKARSNDSHGADSVLRVMIKKYPDSDYADDALFLTGQISEIDREYETAASYYSKVATEYRYSNSAVVSRIRDANVRLILRQPPQALVSLEKTEAIVDSIAANPEGTLYEKQTYIENPKENIIYIRGEAYNLLGKYEKASEILEDFLLRYPNSKIADHARLGAAWAALNLDDNKRALELYDEILTSGKDLPKVNALAQLYRAIALKRAGDLKQAKKELSATSVNPSYPYIGQALLELGQIYYEEGDYELARRSLERGDREAIDAVVSARIHLLLGACYIQMERWDPAIREYESAQKLAQNSRRIYLPDKDEYIAEARLKKGVALVKSHRSAEAIPVLQAYLGDSGEKRNLVEALFWLAEAFYRNDLLKNAVDSYKKALEINPKTERLEEILYGLGWAYFRQRDFSNSSRYFDKMIREFPESEFAIEVLTRQGDGYYLEKRFAQAAESYRKAAELAPNTDEGQYSAYQLCHSLYRTRSFDRATTSLLRFVRQYPQSPYAPNALYLIGWIKFQQRNYKEAVDNYTFLIQAYSQSGLIPNAYYSIGDAYYNTGDFEAAIDAYKKVIEMFPSSAIAPEAMKSVQYCYVALGREDEAIKSIDQYVNENPSSPFAEEFAFKKPNLFYSGRKYRDAVSEYENFIKKYPESRRNSEALYWMGKSYVYLNQKEDAERTLLGLVDKYPDSEYAPQALLEIALMKKRDGDLEQADSTFSQIAALYPKSESAAQAGFERATMKYENGDTLAAMKIYEQVADNYEGLEFADQSRYRVAMYLKSIGEREKARQCFSQLAAREDEAPALAAEALFRIGELWTLDENYERAVAVFNSVKDKYAGFEDWHSLSLFNLGKSYEALEDFESAREIYKTLLALREGDEFGDAAKQRLKIIENE